MGNQGGKNQQGPTDYNLAQRETQVMQLRLQGLGFDAIAQQVGYTNASGAWKAWKRVLSRMPVVETKHEREESRMRLDAAVAAIWKRVQQGDLWAIDRLIALEKRRAELMGLDLSQDDATGPSVVVREVTAGMLPLEALNARRSA